MSPLKTPSCDAIRQSFCSDMPTTGLGLRNDHYQQALSGTARLDFIEVHSENFFNPGGMARYALSKVAERYPVSLHGTALGLGSAAGIDRQYLAKLKNLVDEIDPVMISDHACFSHGLVKGQRVHAGDLLPTPFNQEAVEVFYRNISQVQEALGRQILIENLSSYLEFEQSTQSEPDFLNEIALKSGCGLLVDLNNVLINAHNHIQHAARTSASSEQQLTVKGTFNPKVQREIGVDNAALDYAITWFKGLESTAIKEFHLAGYSDTQVNGWLVDDHSQSVSAECWRLYQFAIQDIGPRPTLIEWDAQLPSWDLLVEQTQIARQIAEQVYKARLSA